MLAHSYRKSITYEYQNMQWLDVAPALWPDAVDSDVIHHFCKGRICADAMNVCLRRVALLRCSSARDPPGCSSLLRPMRKGAERQINLRVLYDFEGRQAGAMQRDVPNVGTEFVNPGSFG